MPTLVGAEPMVGRCGLVLIAIDRVIEGKLARRRGLYSPPGGRAASRVLYLDHAPGFLLHFVHGSDKGRHTDGPEDGWVQVDGGVCDMCMCA